MVAGATAKIQVSIFFTDLNYDLAGFYTEITYRID
jgi:hypothetical protein